ncbi:MAG TPA: serine hydrolase [Terriglobales bacterium]|nr:serine hydrolase [Terriglobales bacterium]
MRARGAIHLSPSIVVALSLGILAGSLVPLAYQRFVCGDYRYINGDLACSGAAAISKRGYALLNKQLHTAIAGWKSEGGLVDASVYFRDLSDGPLMGINENLPFIPASLLKLPIVMAYFEREEEQAGLLETQLLYSDASVAKEAHLPQVHAHGTSLQQGQLYTIEDLMRSTITHSDNVAYTILVDYMNRLPDGTAQILRTFRELGIVDPATLYDEVITVRGYASLFRILYNVAYLSPSNSEKVLRWLAEARFPKGLAAGLPVNVAVASKFGERSNSEHHLQLHDCGIVYYPQNPYLLCVMTKGRDWATLEKTIGTISRMVYQEVDSRRAR